MECPHVRFLPGSFPGPGGSPSAEVPLGTLAEVSLTASCDRDPLSTCQEPQRPLSRGDGRKGMWTVLL